MDEHAPWYQVFAYLTKPESTQFNLFRYSCALVSLRGRPLNCQIFQSSPLLMSFLSVWHVLTYQFLIFSQGIHLYCLKFHALEDLSQNRADLSSFWEFLSDLCKIQVHFAKNTLNKDCVDLLLQQKRRYRELTNVKRYCCFFHVHMKTKDGKFQRGRFSHDCFLRYQSNSRSSRMPFCDLGFPFELIHYCSC